MNLSVTAVVVTYNRADKLPTVLDRLRTLPVGTPPATGWESFLA